MATMGIDAGISRVPDSFMSDDFSDNPVMLINLAMTALRTRRVLHQYSFC